MSIEFDDSGLKKFQQEFDKKKSDVSHIPVDEIFTAKFMAANTRFSSILGLISASGVSMDSFGNIPDSDAGKLNDLVSANTKFQNWNEMCQAATVGLLKK